MNRFVFVFFNFTYVKIVRNSLHLLLSRRLLFKPMQMLGKLFLFVLLVNYLVFLYHIFCSLCLFQYNFVDAVQLTDSVGWMSYYPSIKSLACAEKRTNNVIFVNPVVCSVFILTFFPTINIHISFSSSLPRMEIKKAH